MKHLLYIFAFICSIALLGCGDKNKQIVEEIDSQVDSVMNILNTLEQKNFNIPQTRNTLTGYFGEDGKPVMVRFDAYPDFVQYFYNKDRICILHNIIGEGGISGVGGYFS